MSETVIIPTDSASVQAHHFVTMIEPVAGYFDPIFFDNTYFDISTPTVAITDTLTGTYGGKRTMSETVTVSDALARLYGSIRTLAETVGVSDVIATLGNYFRNLTEPTVLFDPAYFDPAYFDSGGTTAVTDTVTAQSSFFRGITDAAITILETLAAKAGLFRVITEVTAILETLSTLGNYFRSIDERPPVFFDPAYFDPAYFDTTAPSYGITDTVKVSMGGFRGMTETAISILDSIVRKYSAMANFAETVLISDLLARIVHVKGNISETVTTLDSVTASVFRFASLRVRQTAAFIAKRLTQAFISKRKTSGAVV